jgi:hypothetical protein
MPSEAEATREPIVLKWHPGGTLGALWDDELNWRDGKELLDWAKRGIDFVVLDAVTGKDITRVFLIHYDEEGRLIDPIGARERR